MRLIRFMDAVGEMHYGVDQGDGAALRVQGDILANFTVTHQKIPVARLLAPIVPSAIICIGLNYRKHAAETGAKVSDFPVVFMKNPAALQNPSEPIEIPTRLASHKVDFEAELAVVIGRRAKNLTAENALSCVLGYSIGNDVSARDWQKEWGGSQWGRAKSFDTFCPLGPCIVTADEIPNPNALAISTRLNGHLMQESNTSDMIFSVRQIITFLTGSTTLLPGTVILTGTPEGVGMARQPPVWLKAGDRLTLEIEKIGQLSNPVTLEPAS